MAVLKSCVSSHDTLTDQTGMSHFIKRGNQNLKVCVILYC